MAITHSPAGRYNHVAIWTGSEMIVWGGVYRDRFGMERALNSGARYSPVSNTWTPMTEVGAPPGGTTAVWTGREMLVPGATGADGIFRYIPDLSADELRIASAVHENGVLTLRFSSVVGRSYTLWTSDSLVHETWSDTGLPALAGTGQFLSFQISTSASPSRFFRIQAAP